MTLRLFALNAMAAFKVALYSSIVVALVTSPLYADVPQVRNIAAWYALYFASTVLAGLCLTNGLAILGLMRKPNWAMDQLLLPLAGVLALSWLLL